MRVKAGKMCLIREKTTLKIYLAIAEGGARVLVVAERGIGDSIALGGKIKNQDAGGCEGRGKCGDVSGWPKR